MWFRRKSSRYRGRRLNAHVQAGAGGCACHTHSEQGRALCIPPPLKRCVERTRGWRGWEVEVVGLASSVSHNWLWRRHLLGRLLWSGWCLCRRIRFRTAAALTISPYSPLDRVPRSFAPFAPPAPVLLQLLVDKLEQRAAGRTRSLDEDGGRILVGNGRARCRGLVQGGVGDVGLHLSNGQRFEGSTCLDRRRYVDVEVFGLLGLAEGGLEKIDQNTTPEATSFVIPSRLVCQRIGASTAGASPEGGRARRLWPSRRRPRRP